MNEQRFIIADKETRRKRVSICYSCEENIRDKLCGKCGCLLKPKLTFAKAKCPLNKW